MIRLPSLPSRSRILPPPAELVALLLVCGIVAYLYGGIGYLTAYGPRLSVIQSTMRLYRYEEWQHCALVPFLVIVLVWLKRRALAAIPVQPSWSGAIPVFAACVLFLMSYRLDTIYYAFGSVQLMVAGLVILFFGWGWMKALAFPWLFMVFAWPLFFLDTHVAFPLRVVTSTASTNLLNFIGLHSVQAGTAIQSAPDTMTGIPTGKLFRVDVADPCSGMRSLFALTMIAALYGHLVLRNWWKQAILVAAAIPLAMMGNLFRIVMLTFGVVAMGSDIAIGSLEHPSFYHTMAGFLVFAVAMAGMAALASLLASPHLLSISAFQRFLNEKPPRLATSDGRSEDIDVY